MAKSDSYTDTYLHLIQTSMYTFLTSHSRFSPPTITSGKNFYQIQPQKYSQDQVQKGPSYSLHCSLCRPLNLLRSILYKTGLYETCFCTGPLSDWKWLRPLSSDEGKLQYYSKDISYNCLLSTLCQQDDGEGPHIGVMVRVPQTFGHIGYSDMQKF